MNKNIIAFLIDDDREDQLFFELAISDIEWPVSCWYADDPVKGIEMLNSRGLNPDFIFVDMNMPKMNGVECLTKIRQMKWLKDVPVYIYSTSVDKLMTEKCIKLGAAGLIKKEPSISAICEKLRIVFDSKFQHIDR